MGEVIWILLLLTWVAIIFWLMQLVSVMTFSDRHFESHTHRLVWFLVIFLTFLIGAIWFQVWKIRVIRLQVEQIKQSGRISLTSPSR